MICLLSFGMIELRVHEIHWILKICLQTRRGITEGNEGNTKKSAKIWSTRREKNLEHVGSGGISFKVIWKLMK
jgi:hypothetical protein